jgi:KDO2-lipid IV(A) lauroyltransferase
MIDFAKLNHVSNSWAGSVTYGVYRLLGALAPRIPATWGHRLAQRVGPLIWHLAPRSRAAVLDNLTHLLGARRHANLVHISQQVFGNQAKNYYDLFRLPSLSDAEVAELVTLRGIDHLKAALDMGRGVIVVSAHLGNLEITAHALALAGYPLLAVMEHLQPERLHHYVTSLRARRGIKLVAADALLKPVYRTLRANGIVGLAVDRDTTETGLALPFCGAPAWLPTGYAQLAWRIGAVLLPCFGLRQPNDTFIVQIKAPIVTTVTEKSNDNPADIQRIVSQVIEVVGPALQEHPEQWVLFQPLWQKALQRSRGR